MTQDLWKSLIDSLPPGLSYTEAATRLGKDYQCVRAAIKRHGYDAVDGRRFSQNHNRKFWFEGVDWKQSNADIGREHGVSRELVRRVRNRLGKPFVESRGRHTSKKG